MNLAAHQRAMRDLIRGVCPAAADGDDYITRVARSRDLQEARRNILLWRIYVLERTCILTVALLRSKRLLELTVEAFIRESNISPFREFQPRAFLAFLTDHTDDALLVSVSEFEDALMKVREGDANTFTIWWTFEPRRVLQALADGGRLDDQLVPGNFISHVSGTLPHLFDTAPGLDEESHGNA